MPVGGALVVVFDPIRDYPWDYEVERRMLAKRGVQLVAGRRPASSASGVSGPWSPASFAGSG